MTTLNQGQEAAAEAFFEFLFADDKEFIVSGPGGTGKTHWMGYIIDKIMPRYLETCKLLGVRQRFDSVAMTATTNKAAEVVARSTKRPAGTVHSMLHLKVTNDFSTGSTRLTRNKDWEVHERKIIFVDECSMIDSPLLQALHEGTSNCKLVYVGDHCQLTPVTETISPIYKKGLPFYELTEQMRTNQGVLQQVWQQLRRTVETGIFEPIPIVPGVIDWLDDTQMEAMLQQKFHSQTHDSRILAYTNNRVMDFNDHIRDMRQLSSTFSVGEYLVCNSAYRTRVAHMAIEEEVTVINVNPNTDRLEIEPGVYFEYRKITLEKSSGDQLTVPIAEDRDHHSALIKHYGKTKQWQRMFQLIEGYPDLRPRDACTVHKAQGSTYESVFIDLGNISTCHNPDQAARMLYVAFSRPRTRVFLYGELAPKYGGLIIP